jgi:hypothetical protein
MILAVTTLMVWETLGWTEGAARLLIRLSAASSLLLFALAWSASSLNALLPGGWLPVLRARRRLGISFALSHTLHFGAIAWLVELAYCGDWSEFDLLGGGLVYAFIYSMALTSNDLSIRILGRRWWRRLHWIGGYVIWIAFTQSYLGSAVFEGRGGYYPLLAVLCLALLTVRVTAYWRRRSQLSAVAGG